MSLAIQFVSEGLIECVGDIPNVAKGDDSRKVCAGKVSSLEKCCTIERYGFREPCPGAVEYALEQRPPEVDFIVEVGLMEYRVSAELNPMEIGDVVKYRAPKTHTFVEDRAMKVGAPLKDSLTERRGPVEDRFIEIEVCLENRTPKIHIFFKNNRPEINDVSECTPDARDIFVKKDLVVFVAF